MRISCTRLVRVLAPVSLVALVVMGFGMGRLETGQPGAAQPRRDQPRDAQRGGAPDIGGMLVKGLNDSPGCLKVITAQTSAGTNTIIAWFENKAAVEKWYDSPTHERVMGMVGADPTGHAPMAHVKDADAPVMVMASITLGEQGVLPGPMPVSQISIELYTPLDAGASVNGRLMPEAIKLEHFHVIDFDQRERPDD